MNENIMENEVVVNDDATEDVTVYEFEDDADDSKSGVGNLVGGLIFIGLTGLAGGLIGHAISESKAVKERVERAKLRLDAMLADGLISEADYMDMMTPEKKSIKDSIKDKWNAHKTKKLEKKDDK